MPKGHRATPAEFWTLVQVGHPTQCWPFIGTSRAGGTLAYGQYAGMGAHRYAFQTHYDLPLPSRLVVRHDCDNPLCCNPRHLRIGTPAENAMDASLRSRRSQAKLNADKVRAIRGAAPTVQTKTLAAQFGISETLAHYVRTRQRWNHVADTVGAA
jgi:hypothetical protein